MSNINQESESKTTTSEIQHIDDLILLNLRDLGMRLHFLYEGKDSQRRALIALLNNGKMTQRELTEKLSIKPGSMSEVITKLYNKGYVTRTQSKVDKRTVIISLTQLGEEQAYSALEYRTERRGEMFVSLDEGEKYTLLSLLKKINVQKQ